MLRPALEVRLFKWIAYLYWLIGILCGGCLTNQRTLTTTERQGVAVCHTTDHRDLPPNTGLPYCKRPKAKLAVDVGMLVLYASMYVHHILTSKHSSTLS